MAIVEELEINPDGDGELYGNDIVVTPASMKKHSLSGLKNYATDRRADPGAVRDFIGTFDGWDYAQTLRENLRARTYEYLLVELRLNGRVHGQPKVLHVKPRVEAVEFSTRTPQPASEGRPRPRKKLRPRQIVVERDDASHDLVNKLLEKTEQLTERAHQQELARIQAEANARFEVAQAQTRAEIEKINARLEQKESAPDEKREPPFNLVNKVGEFLFDKAKGGDETDAQRLVKFVSGDSAEEKDTSWTSLVGDLLGKAIDNPQSFAQVAGIGVQMFHSLRAPRSQPVVNPQPQPTPQPQVSPQAATPAQPQPEARTFETEVTRVAGVMLHDMGRGARVGACAREFVRLLEEFPEESAMVAISLEQPTELLMQSLLMQLPQSAELLNKPESLEWLRAMQADVLRRRPPQASAASNGNGAHAETVTA